MRVSRDGRCGLQFMVEEARLLAVRVAGHDGIGRALSDARTDEQIIDTVWCLPLTHSQRYRVADAMMRLDIKTIIAIGHEVASAVLSADLAARSSTTDDLVDLAPRPARDAAEAGESDALHGRALGPRHLERGGPGESPPGAGPG